MPKCDAVAQVNRMSAFKSTRHASQVGGVIGVALALLGIAAFAGAPTAREEFRQAAAATPNLANGEKLFETCRACHNSDGSGTNDGNIAAIGGQHFRVVLQQLVDFRSARRWDVRMEHFADHRHLKTPQELADVAGYVASLPPPWPPSFGNGNYLGVGARVYVSKCSSCHGATGQGSNVSKMPRISGQHFAYTVRQLQDAADGRRPNMSPTHGAMVKRMSFEEIQGVADYLARMQPAARVRVNTS
jgi:cytochrome c553